MTTGQQVPVPHRIVTRISDLTKVPHYRSIERLPGVLFVDDILRHNHSANITKSRCESCGYEMNYYDVMYYTVKTGIHPREQVKYLLSSAPLEYIDVTFKDIQCAECGAPIEVVIEGYMCLWRTDQLGRDVMGEVKGASAARCEKRRQSPAERAALEDLGRW